MKLRKLIERGTLGRRHCNGTVFVVVLAARRGRVDGVVDLSAAHHHTRFVANIAVKLSTHFHT